MTVESLLRELQAEEDFWRKEYDEYFREFKEVGKKIKEYYENPFLHPSDIPTELMDEASDWHAKYMNAHKRHRDIQISIIVIEDLLGEL